MASAWKLNSPCDVYLAKPALSVSGFFLSGSILFKERWLVPTPVGSFS